MTLKTGTFFPLFKKIKIPVDQSWQKNSTKKKIYLQFISFKKIYLLDPKLRLAHKFMKYFDILCIDLIKSS